MTLITLIRSYSHDNTVHPVFVSPRGGADFTETRAREGQELDRVVFSRRVIRRVQDGSRLRGRRVNGVDLTPFMLT